MSFVKYYVNNLIEKMKNFTPTPGHVFPSSSFSLEEEILDLAAVIAGTKPAAFVDDSKNPVFIELINRILENKDNVEEIVKNFAGTYSVIIGRKNNVQAIKRAFEKLLLDPNNPRLHKIIGMNLGYPEDQIEDFVKKLPKSS